MLMILQALLVAFIIIFIAFLISFYLKQKERKRCIMETKSQLSLGTLYEANKRLMSNKEIFKPMNILEIGGAQAKIEDFFNMKCDSYAMLYCKDRSDITIFHMYEKQNSNPPALAAKECIGCCTDRGELLSIEKQPDGNFEIWIRINDEPYAYYLFLYDNAVIEV